jgi:hypothetical protein
MDLWDDYDLVDPNFVVGVDELHCGVEQGTDVGNHGIVRGVGSIAGILGSGLGASGAGAGPGANPGTFVVGRSFRADLVTRRSRGIEGD